MTHGVLLVDDDLEILGMFQRLLRREPYDLAVASGADQALEILAEQPISVLVADQRMPGISGTELLSRVHLEHPSIVRMLLTAQASLDVAMKAINEGHVYRFLLKPVRASELGAAIRSALTEWNLRNATASMLAQAEQRDRAVSQLVQHDPPAVQPPPRGRGPRH